MGSYHRALAEGCVICRAPSSLTHGCLVRSRECELILVAYGDDPVAAVIDSQPQYLCQRCFTEAFGNDPPPGIHILEVARGCR